MIISTSNGLSSDKLFYYVKNHVLNLKTAVIVTTASVGYKEKDKHIPRITKELEALNLSVGLFDFDTDDPIELLNYDVVVLNGGNPFYLLKSIKNNEAENVMKQIAEKKLLIGISAGAIILQNDINLIAEYSPEMNKKVGLEDLTALGIVDYDILPHYGRFLDKFERFEETAKEYEVGNNCSVIRINDGQGVTKINYQIVII